MTCLIMKNWIWWWRQNWNGATISIRTSKRGPPISQRRVRLLIWSTKLPSVEPRQDKNGGKLLHRAGRLKIVFSGKQLGLVQEETLVVFYTRMPRETVRTTWDEVERRKKFALGASMLFSTESEETDWREKIEQSKGQSCDWSWKFLVYCGQDEKYRRVILDIIPYVVVASLETDAFMAIVACFDMLTVKGNPARVRKKRGFSRSSCFSEKKKRSKVVYLKTQIQRNLFHGKLKNWDWTLRRDTPGNSWDAPGTKLKFGKEKGNLEAWSKKVNLMSEILARPVLRNSHLRKPHDKQVVPAK